MAVNKIVIKDENQIKLQQIEEILGATESKTVVGRIKNKIAEIKAEFDESLDDYSELMELADLEHHELSIDADPDRSELFEAFKDNQYSIEYYDVESFMESLDSYFKDRYRYACRIRDLKDLLE